MVTSVVQDITKDSHHWHGGEDRTIRHDVVDASESPQSMSGWALRWELFNLSGTSQFAKTTGGGGITIGDGDGTNDRATVEIDAADTSSLSGTYKYELARTDTGNKIVLAKGFAQIEAAETV